MREVARFVSSNDAYFLMGLCAFSLILIVYSITLSRRLSRLANRRQVKLSSDSVEDVLENLAELSDHLSALRKRLEEFDARQNEQNAVLAGCLRNVGMVRFNAFEDVGGEQSFALALLDANRDGVVISSLYGRQDSRLYAKGILKGEGERALSSEEHKALEKALA